MSPHNRVSLRSVTPPLVGWGFVSAPPVLNASNHTTDFCCCNCGAVLMHAEADQVFGLTIQCTKCGSFNSTDV
jgi:predicted RNA-binding Zn-ribbon protein involved in translation (DUF1610 family)